MTLYSGGRSVPDMPVGSSHQSPSLEGASLPRSSSLVDAFRRMQDIRIASLKHEWVGQPQQEAECTEGPPGQLLQPPRQHGWPRVCQRDERAAREHPTGRYLLKSEWCLCRISRRTSTCSSIPCRTPFSLSIMAVEWNSTPMQPLMISTLNSLTT
jgi:hypothetical protein